MRALAVLAVLAIGGGAAMAAQKTHHHHHHAPKKKPPAPAPAPAPEPAPAPTPTTEEPPPPPPTPEPAAAPVPAPAPAVATIAPPGETPKAPSGHEFLGDMDCSSCHTPDGWKMSPTAGASGFDHDRTGFPLRGAHETTTCIGCHDGRALATACTSCHVDDHRGRNGTACAECHRTTDWKDTSTMARHARTRMPLTGAHAMLDCNACHRRTTERTWSDLPSDCYSCHAADYASPSTHPSHASPTDPITHAPQPPFPHECAQCHNTVTWSAAVVTGSASAALTGGAPPDHETRFAIATGKHRGAPCESCHVDLAQPARVACSGCHAHDTVTLARQHPSVSTGATAQTCLACHPGGIAR